MRLVVMPTFLTVTTQYRTESTESTESTALRYARLLEIEDVISLCPVIALTTLPFRSEHSRITGNAVVTTLGELSK